MHRILIVEDNPVDQRLFEQALSDPTREIEICNDGREALAAFERRAADLVISDIMMPNMEGNELLTELHRRVPGLPMTWHPLRKYLGRGGGDACRRI